MLTRVLELGTNKESFYCLPPEKAVICAWYQDGQGNYNTWEYDFTKYQHSKSGKTVFCGDYAALVI